MKHAFLIIAHNEYPVLEVLLSMLDDERNDIYLHIDKRATELFQQIKKVKMQKAGFYLIENPIKVYWGDISQVQVEYLLFETALSHGPYAYYHLLSGTDLPIKSQDYIHAFFQQNAGKEFVGFWQDAAHQRDLERKVFRYYFFTKRLKDKEHLLHGITALIRNLILAVQKISHYRRKQTFEFKKGGNWISITENAVKYLLQYKEIVLNRMKYTLCADEIFIQTILWNSPFRERMHCTNNANTGSMREIDWDMELPPKIIVPLYNKGLRRFCQGMGRNCNRILIQRLRSPRSQLDRAGYRHSQRARCRWLPPDGPASTAAHRSAPCSRSRGLPSTAPGGGWAPRAG